jgi:hypothetical protein
MAFRCDRPAGHALPVLRHLRASGIAVALAASLLTAAPDAIAQSQAPRIDIQSIAEQWLLAGGVDDPYWVIDNLWGQGSIPSSAFSQGVGGGSTTDGRVAFRMQWQWPQGDTEVKGYPAALYGQQAGRGGLHGVSAAGQWAGAAQPARRHVACCRCSCPCRR